MTMHKKAQRKRWPYKNRKPQTVNQRTSRLLLLRDRLFHRNGSEGFLGLGDNLVEGGAVMDGVHDKNRVQLAQLLHQGMTDGVE